MPVTFLARLSQRLNTAALKRINDKIERLDALLNGLDREVWPDVYDEAAQNRARLQRRRTRVVTALNRTGGTQYTYWGTVEPS